MTIRTPVATAAFFATPLGNRRRDLCDNTTDTLLDRRLAAYLCRAQYKEITGENKASMRRKGVHRTSHPRIKDVRFVWFGMPKSDGYAVGYTWAEEGNVKHELPDVPYAIDALQPYISKETLEFHRGKHHQAYVNNLNNMIGG